MNKLAIILLLIAAFAITRASESQDIPSSARSRAAISRVKPELSKALSRAGFKWGAPIF
jgi:hypothetical protein